MNVLKQLKTIQTKDCQKERVVFSFPSFSICDSDINDLNNSYTDVNGFLIKDSDVLVSAQKNHLAEDVLSCILNSPDHMHMKPTEETSMQLYKTLSGCKKKKGRGKKQDEEDEEDEEDDDEEVLRIIQRKSRPQKIEHVEKEDDEDEDDDNVDEEDDENVLDEEEEEGEKEEEDDEDEDRS